MDWINNLNLIKGYYEESSSTEEETDGTCFTYPPEGLFLNII